MPGLSRRWRGFPHGRGMPSSPASKIPSPLPRCSKKVCRWWPSVLRDCCPGLRVFVLTISPFQKWRRSICSVTGFAGLPIAGILGSHGPLCGARLSMKPSPGLPAIPRFWIRAILPPVDRMRKQIPRFSFNGCAAFHCRWRFSRAMMPAVLNFSRLAGGPGFASPEKSP